MARSRPEPRSHDAPPRYWDDACRELSSTDAVLRALIDRHRRDVLRGSGDGFRTLVNAIVGQQISVAAAAGIWGRLTAAFAGMAPADLAATTDSRLRELGLSWRKAEYVRGAAAAFGSGEIDPNAWDRMTDDEIRQSLTALRGVGPWTAEMVLIFHARRPDILPVGDIGLVNAAVRLYGWSPDAPHREKQRRLREHAEQWRPWRTVATWFIWRDLDVEPVIY